MCRILKIPSELFVPTQVIISCDFLDHLKFSFKKILKRNMNKITFPNKSYDNKRYSP